MSHIGRNINKLKNNNDHKLMRAGIWMYDIPENQKKLLEYLNGCIKNETDMRCGNDNNLLININNSKNNRDYTSLTNNNDRIINRVNNHQKHQQNVIKLLENPLQNVTYSQLRKNSHNDLPKLFWTNLCHFVFLQIENCGIISLLNVICSFMYFTTRICVNISNYCIL